MNRRDYRELVPLLAIGSFCPGRRPHGAPTPASPQKSRRRPSRPRKPCDGAGGRARPVPQRCLRWETSTPRTAPDGHRRRQRSPPQEPTSRLGAHAGDHRELGGPERRGPGRPATRRPPRPPPPTPRPAQNGFRQLAHRPDRDRAAGLGPCFAASGSQPPRADAEPRPGRQCRFEKSRRRSPRSWRRVVSASPRRSRGCAVAGRSFPSPLESSGSRSRAAHTP